METAFTDDVFPQWLKFFIKLKLNLDVGWWSFNIGKLKHNKQANDSGLFEKLHTPSIASLLHLKTDPNHSSHVC